MYQTDQPIIAKHAQANADGLYDVLEFVLVTQNRPFRHVGRILGTIDSHGLDATDVLRHAGITEAMQQSLRILYASRHVIYAECMRRKDETEESLLAYLVSLPHLGLAKAGFVAQLAFGVIGCIDTRNIQLYGFDKRAFRLDKNAKEMTIVSKCMDYMSACASCGTSEQLWNVWCEDLVVATFPRSTKRCNPWGTADEVSALHVTLVCRKAA